MTPDEERLAHEDPAAHACFVRIRALIARRGAWEPDYAIFLPSIATFCSHYLRLAREQREMHDPDLQRELAALVAEARSLARMALTAWGVLDEEFAGAAPALNEQGEDPTIAALCTPLPVPV